MNVPSLPSSSLSFDLGNSSGHKKRRKKAHKEKIGSAVRTENPQHEEKKYFLFILLYKLHCIFYRKMRCLLPKIVTPIHSTLTTQLKIQTLILPK